MTKWTLNFPEWYCYFVLRIKKENTGLLQKIHTKLLVYCFCFFSKFIFLILSFPLFPNLHPFFSFLTFSPLHLSFYFFHSIFFFFFCNWFHLSISLHFYPFFFFCLLLLFICYFHLSSHSLFFVCSFSFLFLFILCSFLSFLLILSIFVHLLSLVVNLII